MRKHSTKDSSTNSGRGEIAIITNNLSYQYWQAEATTAEAAIKAAGYTSSLNAHDADPAEERQLVEAAISSGVKAIILDPAAATASVASVQKAKDAGIPVFLVNAEIDEQGIAEAQIVSNNAQCAAVVSQAWVDAMGDTGTYVELLGPPTDNNSAVRSEGYAGVISQYPGLIRVGDEVANWNR